MTGEGPEEGVSFNTKATMLARHLVAVGQAHDRAAFAALFSHFAPRLKTYFLRLGVADGTAEELAQEAMLMIWRKAALYDPGRAAASTWIFAVARNLRADALRRERRQPGREEVTGSDLPAADVAPAAEETLAFARQETRLREALRELPEEQAQVVQLSYFGDRSHTEIGRELGLPLGTVKGRLRQAMGRLRAALEDEEP